MLSKILATFPLVAAAVIAAASAASNANDPIASSGAPPDVPASGTIHPGRYRIRSALLPGPESLQANTTLGTPTFVGFNLEGTSPGDYELWDVRTSSSEGYTIYNIGLDAYATTTLQAGYVGTSRTSPQSFEFRLSTDAYYMIGLPGTVVIWQVSTAAWTTTPEGYRVRINETANPQDKSQLWYFEKAF